MFGLKFAVVVGSVLCMTGCFLLFAQLDFGVTLRSLARRPRFWAGWACLLLGTLLLILIL